MPASASRSTAVLTSGASGALRMTPREPRRAIVSSTLAISRGWPFSRNSNRDRTTAGRGVGQFVLERGLDRGGEPGGRLHHDVDHETRTTSLTALALARCFTDAGLPDGVLSVLAGPGGSLGDALVTDPRVRKVSFTGSTATSRRITQVAGIKKLSLDVRCTDLGDLAGRSDIITLHLPLTGRTRHLVDDAFLARVKPGAVLVNCSRGGLINTDAVWRALTTGRLSGVGLDVFDPEPPGPHPLYRHPNVVLTPHLMGPAPGGPPRRPSPPPPGRAGRARRPRAGGRRQPSLAHPPPP